MLRRCLADQVVEDSLVDQRDTTVLDPCRDAGIAYVPFFPLGSAFPCMPKVTENVAVLGIAERTRATSAQVGLAWLLMHHVSNPRGTDPDHS